MNLATGIITAPRPKRQTLFDSLASYRTAGGFKNVPTFVFADGPAPQDGGLADRIILNQYVLGNFRNWASALSFLVHATKADWLMMCEDDIVWAVGSYAALQRDVQLLKDSHLFKDSGALSLYLPMRESKEIERGNEQLKDGWHRGPRRGMKTWGAQCLLFSRENALALIKDYQFMAMQNDRKWQRNVDGIVAKCLNDNGKLISYRVPCLVSHSLGEGNSSLGYADERPNLATKYFTGQP